MVSIREKIHLLLLMPLSMLHSYILFEPKSIRRCKVQKMVFDWERVVGILYVELL